MALTPIEIRAILETANWWSEAEFGRVGVGLTPSAVVAQMRGVQLLVAPDGVYTALHLNSAEDRVACLALHDTIDAFGCHMFSEYCALLLAEGPMSLRRLPGVR